MYLADSESSSIRRVDLTTGGSKLLAGGDPTFSDNLFQVRIEWRDGEVDTSKVEDTICVVSSILASVEVI